jgi:hypothetical protein
MDADSLFTRASDLCRETWPKTLFSSFHFFERILLYAEKDWAQMVAISAPQLETDSEMKEKILQRIRNASEEELRSLWINRYGTCASWAVLLASKIAEDPNDLYFGDDGHHRVAFTRSGILIDSSAREALQLKDGVKYKYKSCTYTLKGMDQDKPTLSYTVYLYSRIEKSNTNQKIERLKGAYSINLPKLARCDKKFSLPGCIVEGCLVYVPV